MILQGKSGDKNISKQIIILPPGAVGAIHLQTIFEIDAKQPASGTATLVLSFGKDEKHLSHSYEMEGIPNVAFGMDNKGTVVSVISNILFRSVTYT